MDENGNNVAETYKNGKLFSTAVTELHDDGSKTITVHYTADKSGINDIIKIFQKTARER